MFFKKVYLKYTLKRRNTDMKQNTLTLQSFSMNTTQVDNPNPTQLQPCPSLLPSNSGIQADDFRP